MRNPIWQALVGVAILAIANAADAQIITSEPFTSSTVTGWTLQDGACLTSPGGTASCPGGINYNDPAGAGWLRLTTSQTDQTGQRHYQRSHRVRHRHQRDVRLRHVRRHAVRHPLSSQRALPGRWHRAIHHRCLGPGQRYVPHATCSLRWIPRLLFDDRCGVRHWAGLLRQFFGEPLLRLPAGFTAHVPAARPCRDPQRVDGFAALQAADQRPQRRPPEDRSGLGS